jgi:hypothetical protein
MIGHPLAEPIRLPLTLVREKSSQDCAVLR